MVLKPFISVVFLSLYHCLMSSCLAANVSADRCTAALRSFNLFILIPRALSAARICCN
ncbi:hypothetical protein Hanom_Chr04g00300091 [Helianthus anomalus]